MADELGIVAGDDMDVDMDIDLGPMDEFQEGNFNQQDLTQTGLTITSNETNGVDSLQQPGVGPETELTPNKVYIHGLDNLTTKDIRAFSAKHFPSCPPARVEWIDDSSANIVFEDETTAIEALEHFSVAPNVDSVPIPKFQLRTAKILPSHPDSNLQVRTSFTADQKRPRAYEASRFYMMHPEHDPREKRRRGERSYDSRNGDYRRRGYSDEEHRRRRRKDREDGFDASMYDDNAPSSRRDSMGSSPDFRSDDNGRRSRRRGDSYRPTRGDRGGASRDRSASPGRPRRTPPPSYRTQDPYPFPRENKGKELFPTKSEPNSGLNRGSNDLFSNKLLAADLKKELFPQKANGPNHRRSDAFDAADETADLFANGLSMSNKNSSKAGKSLADRITNGPTTSYGRLKASDPVLVHDTLDMDNSGISILGASSQQDQGFSIRGGAAAGTIKELSPGKAVGNAGKELFAERLEGRGGRRNKAEDMFY